MQISILRRLSGVAAPRGLRGHARRHARLGQKKADPTKKPLATPRVTSGPALTAEQLARHIDAAILAGLKAEKTDPSPVCSDEEFLRRVYLDLAGQIPTAEQAAAFLDSKEPDKRAKLIDELLASPGVRQAPWPTSGRRCCCRATPTTAASPVLPDLVKWLEEQFNANARWDKMVHDLLTATRRGRQDRPGTYCVANATPDKMTDNVTRMFLGVQLQCAQCHNHPFTDWKQNEYWEHGRVLHEGPARGQPQGGRQERRHDQVGESQPPRKARRRACRSRPRSCRRSSSAASKPDVKAERAAPPVWPTG